MTIENLIWNGFEVTASTNKAISCSDGSCGSGSSVSVDGNLKLSASASSGNQGANQSASAVAKLKIPNLQNIKTIFIDVSGRGNVSWWASGDINLSAGSLPLASESLGKEQEGSFNFGNQLLRIEGNFLIGTNGDVMNIAGMNELIVVFSASTKVNENRSNGSSEVDVIMIDITREEIISVPIIEPDPIIIPEPIVDPAPIIEDPITLPDPITLDPIIVNPIIPPSEKPFELNMGVLIIGALILMNLK